MGPTSLFTNIGGSCTSTISSDVVSVTACKPGLVTEGRVTSAGPEEAGEVASTMTKKKSGAESRMGRFECELLVQTFGLYLLLMSAGFVGAS